MWCIWDPGCNKFPVSSLPDLPLYHCSSLLPEAPHPLGVLVTRSFHPIQFCILYYAVVFCFPRNFTFQRWGVSGSGLNNDKMRNFLLKTLQWISFRYTWNEIHNMIMVYRPSVFWPPLLQHLLPCSSFLHDDPKALASLLSPNMQSMLSMCILYICNFIYNNIYLLCNIV